ncbi:SPOR domain-containing protein [Qipengyuania nanhaisediminis]|uniref:SPOR domain-containing protein n=1 Tax=Qipengyuania nanhaisediminis TaxID=604088 RepID=UPI0038B3D708
MAITAHSIKGLVRRSALLGAAAACAALAAPAQADVKAGVDAWSAGEYSVAVAEWRGPAQAGDADALFNLAQAYRLGRGVEPDVERARQLYAQAADRGHVKAADNYGLLLFQQGEQDAAMPLIRAAAERGDPRAQYVLGLAHFNADYAERDWVRAYALLTLANAAGLPQAGNALGQMDDYVPLAQRQQAQSLARQIEAESEHRRAAELAAVDLGNRDEPAAPARASEPPRRSAALTRPSSRPVPVPASQRRVPAQAAPQRASGNWGVQLGAFGVRDNADRLWSRLESNPALAGTRKTLINGGNVTRLRAVGFASQREAQDACNTLKRQGQGCIVARP